MTYNVTRKEVVDAVLKCRGVRFRHQGRSMETGVDCAGLLYVVLQALRYPAIVDVEGYRSSPPAALIRATLRENFDEIPLEEVGPGDIYLMRIGHSIKPKHSAFLVSDQTDIAAGVEPQVVHAYGMNNTGVVIMEALSAWQNRLVYGFRLRGLVH